MPQPEQPPDSSLEALTRQGLTPAQAYQAQVYLSSPAGQQSNWTPYRAASPAPSPSTSPTNVQSHYIDPEPALPQIDGDHGVLSIDYEGDSSPEGEYHSLYNNVVLMYHRVCSSIHGRPFDAEVVAG